MKLALILAVACALLVPASKASAANRRKHMSGMTRDGQGRTTLGPRGRNTMLTTQLGSPAQSQTQTQSQAYAPVQQAGAAQQGAQAQNQAQADGQGVQPTQNKPRPRSRTGH